MIRTKHLFPFLLVVFLGLFFSACQQNMNFDSAKWKQSGGENILLDTRKQMVNDLLKCEILLHKSHNQIVKLIGSPVNYNNTVFDFKEYYPVQEKYDLGIDPEEMTFLEITFDKNGISESVKFISSKEE